ncbi:MAG: VanZ family protein [Niveispirillum sp.]|uniref:VanZ family protein n=1 Tax=Niveispirillum sp. TaxID=1917217 RepID=UPI0006B9EDB9
MIRHSTGGLILAVAILLLPWMAVQPQLAPPAEGGADKYLHMFCFAGLAFIGLWTVRTLHARMVVLAFLLLLGAGIEWLQASVPGRQGSWGDLAADATGLLLALILLRCWPTARDMLSREGD